MMRSRNESKRTVPYPLCLLLLIEHSRGSQLFYVPTLSQRLLKQCLGEIQLEFFVFIISHESLCTGHHLEINIILYIHLQ